MVTTTLSTRELLMALFTTLHLWHVAVCNATAESHATTKSSALSAKRASVMLLSFEKRWKLAHTVFARSFEGTLTKWCVADKGFLSFVDQNILRCQRNVIVSAYNSSQQKQAVSPFRTALARHVCATWLFTDSHIEIPQYARHFDPAFSSCQVIGVLDIRAQRIKDVVWPSLSPITHNTSDEEVRSMLRLESAKSVRISGKRVTVLCIEADYYGSTQDSCEHPVVQLYLRFLREANASVNVVTGPRSEFRMNMSFSKRWDVEFLAARFHTNDVFYADIPQIYVSHEAFYSRTNDHRIVTVTDVVDGTWKLLAPLLALAFAVSLVVQKMKAHTWLAFESTIDTLTVLLASVLATSVSWTSRSWRVAKYGKALYYLWFIGMIPLSSYFRSELTSKITLKQPGDRIDTLQKLEDALDQSKIAPCCTENSAIHDQLAHGNQPESSLLSKLQAAFKRHDAEELVKGDFSECLSCALRPDRVCYGTFEHACYREKQIAGVRLFKENYKMSLSGFKMPKSLSLYRPLQRFFRALKEGKLIDEDYFECDRGILASTAEFDLRGFFVQYVVLQALCCVVLAVEIVVARLQRTRRAKWTSSFCMPT